MKIHMSEFQVASFILLWIVILVEGVLLFLLYRHVALQLPMGSIENLAGLAAGSSAPMFAARDKSGNELSLTALLKTEYTLFIFGSFSCSPCRTLVFDQYLHYFLKTNTIQAYFITRATEVEDETSEFLDFRENPLKIITVEEKVFEAYLIQVTPFIYILDKTGMIRASTQVDEVKSLVGAFEQIIEDIVDWDSKEEYHHNKPLQHALNR